MKNTNRWLNRFAALLSAATLALIFIGGLVTSTHSGLAVPDWPLSYGRLMPRMVGGILFEHGHRMAAAGVGFLTVLLALFVTWKEDRKWMKAAAWAAVGLVVLQGLLGGLTVLLRLPKTVSVAHACLAQTFFCLTAAIVVWTSDFWRQASVPRVEPANKIPFHRVALALFLCTYAQLVFGAILRHTGWALPFHIVGAILVAVLSFWTSARVLRDHFERKRLRLVSSSLMALVLFQIALGIASYIFSVRSFGEASRLFWAPAVITLHVMTGAAILGLSLIMALAATRTRPSHTAPIKTTLSDYLTLTKPGISFTAGITALAGFVLGSKGDIDLARLFYTGLGTLMAAAGAGTLNMLFEMEVDSRMNRTKTRPLPSGRLQPGEALFFGVFLSGAGTLYLAWNVNFLTAGLAALTVSLYLYVYTPLKKISSICVNIGAVAGALPPVMGWTAASNRLGWEAVALFGILFFWQFPHFLSLAWLYKDDYAKAGLRMLPHIGSEALSEAATARSIFLHSIGLLAVSSLPTFMGLTGGLYLSTAIASGLALAVFSAFFLNQQTRPRALRLFLFSLVYIPLVVVFMVLNRAAV